MKTDTKSNVRHFLMNLLYMLKLEISAINMSKKDKEALSGLADISSLIVTYEKILAGEKPNSFIQRINLGEVCTLTELTLKSKFGRTLFIPSELDNCFIQADNNMTINAMMILCEALAEKSGAKKAMHFSVKARKLILTHNVPGAVYPSVLPDFKYQQIQNFDRQKFSAQLSMSIFKAQKIDMRMKKGRVEFDLKEVISNSSI
jgi:hypothetical protein